MIEKKKIQDEEKFKETQLKRTITRLDESFVRKTNTVTFNRSVTVLFKDDNSELSINRDKNDISTHKTLLSKKASNNALINSHKDRSGRSKGKLLTQNAFNFFAVANAAAQSKKHNTNTSIRSNEIVQSENKQSESLPKQVNKQSESLQKQVNEPIHKESEFSRKISEKRTKILIVLVMALIIVVPFFDEEWISSEYRSYNSIVYFLNGFFLINDEQAINITKSFLAKNIGDPLFPIINVSIYKEIIFINQTLLNEDFRSNELNFNQDENGPTLITYSNKTHAKYIGYVGIVRSFLLISIIMLFFIKFEKDIKELIVDPLEIMLEIVDNVAKDPNNAKNVKEIQKGGIKKLAMKLNQLTQNLETYEIKTIQSSIIKISALLSTGFGEAGCQIIKQNLDSKQSLNYIHRGKRVYGLFGFCEIRNFVKLNECLEEKAMILVNEICYIVHSCVHLYGGYVNKNIGESFLVVWKIKDEDVLSDQNGLPKFNSESEELKNTCTQAIISFLSILIRINNSPLIAKYRYNNEILKRIKNFKLSMGFGLHIGWAIEGTIGSPFKIDASYLSPYVNLAARLNAATKQYGVSLLFSGEIFDFLQDDIKEVCRVIDRVTLKGSISPIILYTIDTNSNLEVKKKSHFEFSSQKALRVFDEKKEKLKLGIKLEGSLCKYIFSKTSFQQLLKTSFSAMFNSVYNEAINSYFIGDWKRARELFNEGLELLDTKTYGPIVTLLNYMRTYKYQAPKKWRGCRNLTSK